MLNLYKFQKRVEESLCYIFPITESKFKEYLKTFIFGNLSVQQHYDEIPFKITVFCFATRVISAACAAASFVLFYLHAA